MIKITKKISFFSLMIMAHLSLAMETNTKEIETGKKFVIAMPAQDILEKVFIAHDLGDFIAKTNILERLSKDNLKPVTITCRIHLSVRRYIGILGTHEQIKIWEAKIYAAINEALSDRPEAQDAIHLKRQAYWKACEYGVGEQYVMLPAREKLEQVFIAHGLKDFIDKTKVLHWFYEKNTRVIEVSGIVSWFLESFLKGSCYTLEEKITLENKIYAVLNEIFIDQPETIKAIYRQKKSFEAENGGMRLAS